MARILIISPGSPCRNPRPVKEADTLGRAGHEVTLLTAAEGPEYYEQERALTAGAPYRHEAVDRDPSRLVHFWRRLRRRLAVKSTELGWDSLHALGHAGSLLDRARAIPADLTIVHNEVPHWIGCRLLAEGRRVAADFEDWHTEDLLPGARRGRPLRRMREIEGQLLRSAAYTSTTSVAMSRALAARYAAPPPLVLTNSFPLQPRPRTVSPGEPPVIFWFSQTIGPGRGLDEFFLAWRETKQPSRVVLLGHLLPAYGAHLRSLLSEDFQRRLTFRPLVSPLELPDVIASHDIGLALEHSEPANKDLTISNKILQYLNAGIAVVATATAGQREVMERCPDAGCLVTLDDSHRLAARLDTLLADRAALAGMGAAARRAAASIYCWEQEAPRLVERVDAALAAPR